MKKIIYGKAGYGKSFTYIAPVLRDNNNVLLITPNGIDDELKYMKYPAEINPILINGIEQISTGKYGICMDRNSYPVDDFLKLVTRIGKSELSKRKDYTIIFTNTSHFLIGTKICDVINNLNTWNCDILFEHTCRSSEECINDLCLNDSCWDEWDNLPVLKKLY